MSEMLFYQKLASLDPARHGKLKIRPTDGFAFAAQVNSVPIVAAEFAEVSKEYPIAFARAADDAFLPVAIVGLRDNENLFVDAAGKWDARYVPAFVRRYPFVPADVGEGKTVLCIDESAACLNEESGEPLFVEDAPGAFVRGAIDLLGEYQAAAQRTAGFARELAEADVLVEHRAQIALNDGGKFFLSGMYVIDEARLQRLEGERAKALLANGSLGLAYAHLLSLSNFQRLVDRLAARRAN